MKYLLLFVFILCRIAALFAQTNIPASTQEVNSKSSTAVSEQPYPTATMVKVNRKKISEGLKMTLQNVGYAGWEKGQIYLDTVTNEYALLFPVNRYDDKNSGKGTEKQPVSEPHNQKWYFFTYEGKPFSYNQ